MGKGKIDYGGMLQKYLESREKSGNVEPSSQSGTDAEVVSIIQASKQIMGKRTTNESAPQPTGATTDTQNVSNGEYRIAEVENNPNRIKVKMSSGTAFECDRFCPHKGADLLQVSLN